MTNRKIAWTPEAIRALGVATNVETAASIFDISRGYAYRLVREDRFPVGIVRIGERTVVPVAGILALLGVLDDAEEVAA